MIARQTGATLCAVPRCPNRLGNNPYRYCLEHLPPQYLKRAIRYSKDGDPRKARVAIGQKLRAESQAAVMALLANNDQWTRGEIRKKTKRRFSDTAIDKALSALMVDGRIVKVKVGVYCAIQSDAPAPELLGCGGARTAILAALNKGNQTHAELRRAAPARYGTFRDALGALLRKRQIRRVSVGVYACAK